MKNRFKLILIIITLSINLPYVYPQFLNEIVPIKEVKAIENFNAKQLSYSTNLQVLDSSILLNYNYTSDKNCFYFNEFGKDTLNKLYFKNLNSSTWTYYRKRNNYYNSKGFLTKQITYKIISSNTSEVFQKKNVFYNTMNYIVEIVDSMWDNNTKIYKPWSKTVYQRDLNGNILNCTTYNTDSLCLTFQIAQRYTYQYNSQNSIISYISEEWDSGLNSLVNKTKFEFSYNSNQDTKRFISYYWNTNTSLWDSTGIINCEYNYLNSLIYKNTYSFTSGNKYLDHKNHYSYDANNYLIEDLDSIFSPISQSFEPNKKNTYIRDSLGNKTQESISYYGSNGWSALYKYYYSYNTNYLIKDIIFPYDTKTEYFYTEYQKLSETEMSNLQHSGFDTSSVVTYYYSEKPITSGFDEFDKQHFIKVYPNPAFNNLFFMFSENGLNFHIEVYDINGKLLKVEDCISSTKISIRDLSNGIYLYRIYNDKENYSGKFIVKH